MRLLSAVFISFVSCIHPSERPLRWCADRSVQDDGHILLPVTIMVHDLDTFPPDLLAAVVPDDGSFDGHILRSGR